MNIIDNADGSRTYNDRWIYRVDGDEEILETTLRPGETKQLIKPPAWWRRGDPAPTVESIAAEEAQREANRVAGELAAAEARAVRERLKAEKAAIKAARAKPKSNDPSTPPSGATLIEDGVALRQSDGRYMVFVNKWSGAPSKTLDTARAYLAKVRERSHTAVT